MAGCDAFARRGRCLVRFSAVAIGGLLFLTVLTRAQTTLYWDTNGTTSGAGATPAGTWSTSGANTDWTTGFFGTSSTIQWTDGSNADFSAGFDATSSYTVTVSGTVSAANVTVLEGTPTFSGGTINLSGSSPGVSTILGSSATINSLVTGTGGLSKSGNGTLVLGNAANSYTGATAIAAGTLQLGATNAIPSGSAVTVSSGATLDFGTGHSLTVASLAGAGGVNLRNNTLTVGNSTNTTFSGVISDGGASGSLVKQGSGTLTLSGANTYTGTTAINAGTLQLGASTTLASGTAVTVASGATLDVNSFTQTIGSVAGSGNIVLGSGSLTAGGNNATTTFGGTLTGTGTFVKAGTGTLSLSSNISFGGTFVLSSGTLQLSGTTLNLGTLDITGNSVIDFAGAAASLNVTNLFIQVGSTLSIINWQNSVDFFYAGNWSGGTYYTAGSNPMNQVSFSGYSANTTRWQSYDNQITPVPEPAAYGAILLVALLGLVARRRSW